MKFIKSKKGLALLATVAVVAIAAVGALAYFVTGGSGRGTATAGSLADSKVAITLTASGFDGIYPGGLAKSVHYTATNASTTTSGFVGTISLVSVTDEGNGGNAAACSSYLAANQDDFTLTPEQEDTVVPKSPTAATDMPNDASLTWADNASADQTPCANEPLTLNVSST
jgi:hypothetical protein